MKELKRFIFPADVISGDLETSKLKIFSSESHWNKTINNYIFNSIFALKTTAVKSA